METRFFAEFTSREGNTWRINILDADFTGTALQSAVAPPGFELEYFGGRDVYSPLMPSTCRVPWMVQSAAEETWIGELSDFQEGRYLIEIVADPDGLNTRHWVGVMSPDSVQIPDASRPFIIGLNAVCGLALLNRLQYDTSTQLSGSLKNTALDHVLNAVRNIPGSTTDIFPISSTMLVAVEDIRPATGTASDNFMQHVYFQAATNDIFQGSNSVGTFEDMLVQVLTMMNARMYQRDGVWILQSITRTMGAVNLMTDVKAFDRLGTTVSSSNISNFRKTINQTTRHRTNGTFKYMPAVRKVSRKIDFFGNVPFAGSSQLSSFYLANDGNTASPYDIGKTITGSSDVTLPTDQTVRATGSLLITAPWFDGSVAGVYQPLERVQRFKVRLKVRVGTKYLRRTAPYDFTYSTIEPEELYTPSGESSTDVEIFNPGALGAFQWTTDSSARVEFWTEFLITGAADFQGIPRRTTLSFDFESPEIGSAEDADVELSLSFAGFHGEADSANPDAYVSQSVKVAGCFGSGRMNLYLGDGSASADSLTYGAELDNNATEELILTTGIYGEVSSADIYVYNPAALLATNFATIPGFYSSVTAATTPLAELICIDRLKHFGAVQRCWQGTIYSPDVLDPFNTFVFDSAVWMPVQMGYSADQDDYEIECIAVEALTVLDPDSTDPVREVGNIQPPNGANEDAIQEQISRGARDRSDLSDTVADIETDVANINRTTDSSGGLSTILLQYLGDVKISGPTNGQVLEYNTAAGRWANVTPSSGTDNSLSQQNQTIAEGVTRDIVLNGSVSNNTYFRITDGSSNLIFSIQNYGTVLNIIEYYGLIAYRSTATAQGSIALYEPAASGTNFLRLQAPALAANITLTLPNSTGASGQVLTTNGSGLLTWETPAAGGAAVLPLANISGRWMWSSADDGERVLTGNTAYGPFNFYSHTSEPSSSTIRIYSAGHVIGTTTGTMPAYYITAFGVHVPTTDKKIRIQYSFRVQNAPNGSTWGMSLWGVATPATGSSANETFTLRGVSSSETATTSSTVLYTGTFTTTAAINGGYVLPMMENRSGSLTTTTYMYGQIQINLVD